MLTKEPTHFHPANRQAWRDWLQKNHATEQAVWVIFYKMKSGKARVSWSDAVDEALCFGWIDSKAKPIDEHTYMQFFSKRKPGGTWSKVNKEKIERLVADKLMAPAGLASIEAAKHSGAWTILDEVEELIIPKDLVKEFRAHPGSKAFFLSLSKSVKKAMLQWLVLAKQPETRQRRINEIAELAGKNMKPKQF